jgi:hypothetical protein
VADALAWLAATPVAMALKASGTLYLVVNAAHILAIGLIVGSILPLDLRLIGVIHRMPLAAIGPLLSRTAAVGGMLAVLTGLCLFSVRPQEYIGNPAFLAKIGLFTLAIANAAILHLGGRWSMAVETERVVPTLRLQAALSMASWIGAVLVGRWIGFI